jgi:uncharacterized membrane protein YccC
VTPRLLRRTRAALLAELRWDRRAGAQGRVLLALKSAVAAGAAWAVAQAVPGAASHYPYYAPLGAVIATGPTVLGGIREGVRTMVGLAVGIALALVVVLVGGPPYVALPIAVAVAILASGFRFVGVANTWVATAAIFVLLVGGSDPTEYSTGYLVQTLIGAVVGVIINMLVFPPLAVRDADRELAALEERLADHLDELAQSLEGDDVDGQLWSERLEQLQAAAAAVRAAVRRADESRRGNPRALRGSVRRTLGSHYERMRALERAVFAVTDLTDIVGQASPMTEPLGGVDAELAPAFAGALRSIAGAVRGGADGDDPAATREQAEAALTDLEHRLDKEGNAHPSEVPASTAAAVALRNIVTALLGASG